MARRVANLETLSAISKESMNPAVMEMLVKARQALSGDATDQHARSDVEDIEDEVDGFLGELLNDRERLVAAAEEIMQPHLGLYDLCLLQLSDISYFTLRNRRLSTRAIWPDRSDGTGILYLLSSNLAQTGQAIRALLLRGFEGQSRAMVRYFVELTDITLAVTADEGFFEKYATVYNDDKRDYQHWRKHLSPGVVRRRLEQLDEDLNLGVHTAVPGVEVRTNTYSWFSRFSHNDLVAHLVSAHSSPLDPDDDTMAPIGVLGYIGGMTRATFSRLLLYLWLFFLHFDRLLREVHKWERFTGRNDRGRYFLRSDVFRTAFEENYNYLQGIKEPGEVGRGNGG